MILEAIFVILLAAILITVIWYTTTIIKNSDKNDPINDKKYIPVGSAVSGSQGSSQGISQGGSQGISPVRGSQGGSAMNDNQRRYAH